MNRSYGSLDRDMFIKFHVDGDIVTRQDIGTYSQMLPKFQRQNDHKTALTSADDGMEFAEFGCRVRPTCGTESVGGAAPPKVAAGNDGVMGPAKVSRDFLRIALTS